LSFENAYLCNFCFLLVRTTERKPFLNPPSKLAMRFGFKERGSDEIEASGFLRKRRKKLKPYDPIGVIATTKRQEELAKKF